MKLTIFTLLFFASIFSFGQSRPDYEKIKLETNEQVQAADTFALLASTYLLSEPFEKNSLYRLQALRFLLDWMTRSPDYTFSIDETATKISKGNDDMLGIFMAAMAKYSMENKAKSKDVKLVKLNAINLLLDYCENEYNNMKMTKYLKKLSEARANGTLEQELEKKG